VVNELVRRLSSLASSSHHLTLSLITVVRWLPASFNHCHRAVTHPITIADHYHHRAALPDHSHHLIACTIAIGSNCLGPWSTLSVCIILTQSSDFSSQNIRSSDHVLHCRVTTLEKARFDDNPNHLHKRMLRIQDLLPFDTRMASKLMHGGNCVGSRTSQDDMLAKQGWHHKSHSPSTLGMKFRTTMRYSMANIV
jgi:hypothetical protein